MKTQEYMHNNTLSLLLSLLTPVPPPARAYARIRVCARQGGEERTEDFLSTIDGPPAIRKQIVYSRVLRDARTCRDKTSQRPQDATRGHTVAHATSARVAEIRRANRYFRAVFQRKTHAGTNAKLERVCFDSRNFQRSEMP